MYTCVVYYVRQSFTGTVNGVKYECAFPDAKWIADVPFAIWDLLKSKGKR